MQWTDELLLESLKRLRTKWSNELKLTDPINDAERWLRLLLSITKISELIGSHDV